MRQMNWNNNRGRKGGQCREETLIIGSYVKSATDHDTAHYDATTNLILHSKLKEPKGTLKCLAGIIVT